MTNHLLEMLLGTMSVHIVRLVFVFIARLRFPLGLTIVEVLYNRYGTDLVKNVRKLTTNTTNCNLI